MVYQILKRPLSLSIISHLFGLIILMILSIYMNIPTYDPTFKGDIIRLEQLDRSDLEKLRTVGIKNGQKNSFQSKIKQNTKGTQARRISKLTLDALKLANIKKSKTDTPTKRHEKIKKAELTLMRRMQKKSTPALKIMREYQIGQNNPETYRRTSFNIDFIPPEGVREDELNSMEKMFYGFQKRTYLTYFNSFIKSYGVLTKKKPKLENAVQNEDHLLTGRITYDQNGHIVAIKILKWSVNDDIQELFEETLKRLKLPNPPKGITKGKEFNIYFQLAINDAKN